MKGAAVTRNAPVLDHSFVFSAGGSPSGDPPPHESMTLPVNKKKRWLASALFLFAL